MSSTRSTTGCYACKTKRKKCDETKPYCLRCQKSRIECPGYTYVGDPINPKRKLWTLPAPRTVGARRRIIEYQETYLTNTEAPGAQLQGQSPNDDPVAADASSSEQSPPAVTNVGTPSEAVDESNPWVFMSSFSGSLHQSSIDLNGSHELATTSANPLTPPSTSMTAGQASLLEALFSLGSPPDVNSPPPCAQHSAHSHPRPSVLQVTNRSSSGIQKPEGVVGVICRQPALDRTAQTNALPFVLQCYTIWISRIAFEPLKLKHIARDFVYDHFGDGEQPRWIMALLANIGSKVGSMEITEGRSNSALSTLHNAVQWWLGNIVSRLDSNRAELVKALDSALEAMVMYFLISPMGDSITLIRAAAPIFRQLCPEPRNTPINLASLLQQPLSCLQRYAGTDIILHSVIDIPTIFRYETTIAAPHPLVPAIQSDGVVQWRHGISNQLVLVFAKMKLMYEDGLEPTRETIASLEQDIRDIEQFQGPSSDRFVAIMRSVVQECWRQAAFVYLYMAVCGDPSDTPRVKEARKHFMRLLNGTKAGRFPDEFLILPMILISPASQRNHDREDIKRRLLGVHRPDRIHIANYHILRVIEDYWDRADAERRPIRWLDVAVSRRKLLGI